MVFVRCLSLGGKRGLTAKPDVHIYQELLHVKREYIYSKAKLCESYISHTTMRNSHMQRGLSVIPEVDTPQELIKSWFYFCLW